MRLSSSLLLLSLIPSAVSNPDYREEGCKQCLTLMYRPFRKCAQQCNKAVTTLGGKPTGVAQEVKCESLCQNEVNACVKLGFCSGTTCDPYKWNLADEIQGDLPGSAIGGIQTVYSKKRIASYDNNYECDDNTPGINCKGAVQVYKKKKNGWVKEATLTGDEKGDDLGREISMSSDGSVIAIGGEKTWRIQGLEANYECAFDRSDQLQLVPHTPGTVHTVAVSPNGKYIALGRSSPSIDAGSELRILENNPSPDRPCPYSLIGTVTGTNYDFGAISIDDNGEKVLIANYQKGEVRIAHLEGKAWKIGSNYVPTSQDVTQNSGLELSASGKVAVVGYPLYNNNQGKVTVYDIRSNIQDPVTFEEKDEIVGPFTGRKFGEWIDIDKEAYVLAVGEGAPNVPQNDLGGDVGGTVRVYKEQKRKYELVKNEITGVEVNGGEKVALGSGVRLLDNGLQMIVGAPDAGSASSGKIYEFDTCGLMK